MGQSGGLVRAARITHSLTIDLWMVSVDGHNSDGPVSAIQKPKQKDPAGSVINGGAKKG